MPFRGLVDKYVDALFRRRGVVDKIRGRPNVSVISGDSVGDKTRTVVIECKFSERQPRVGIRSWTICMGIMLTLA
ncbi:hypothetical protein [Vulcanisaeta sp. JCM 14467]|uniref:hypothetical protein n=1 Tax=Vulcanisaeta sp. JCM 14467 TaxID=1295370 RepID=UPI0006D0C655|nr:hypothetical protein [Vulcanisaeta sp. JCM 14467]